MYEERNTNIPLNGTTQCSETCNSQFNFSEFQARKRILAEETLKVSNFILDCLMGKRPQDAKESLVIDCLMTDLQSEFDTIREVYDNLVRIATYLDNK